MSLMREAIRGHQCEDRRGCVQYNDPFPTAAERMLLPCAACTAPVPCIHLPLSPFTVHSSDTGVHVVSRRFETTSRVCGVLSFVPHIRSHLHVVWKVRECGSKQVPKEGSNRGPRFTWVKKQPLFRKESLCIVHSNGPFPCRRAAARPSLSRPHTDVDPSQK